MPMKVDWTPVGVYESLARQAGRSQAEVREWANEKEKELEQLRSNLAMKRMQQQQELTLAREKQIRSLEWEERLQYNKQLARFKAEEQARLEAEMFARKQRRAMHQIDSIKEQLHENNISQEQADKMIVNIQAQARDFDAPFSEEAIFEELNESERKLRGQMAALQLIDQGVKENYLEPWQGLAFGINAMAGRDILDPEAVMSGAARKEVEGQFTDLAKVRQIQEQAEQFEPQARGDFIEGQMKSQDLWDDWGHIYQPEEAPDEWPDELKSLHSEVQQYQQMGMYDKAKSRESELQAGLRRWQQTGELFPEEPDAPETFSPNEVETIRETAQTYMDRAHERSSATAESGHPANIQAYKEYLASLGYGGLSRAQKTQVRAAWANEFHNYWGGEPWDDTAPSVRRAKEELGGGGNFKWLSPKIEKFANESDANERMAKQWQMSMGKEGAENMIEKTRQATEDNK